MEEEVLPARGVNNEAARRPPEHAQRPSLSDYYTTAHDAVPSPASIPPQPHHIRDADTFHPPQKMIDRGKASHLQTGRTAH